MKTKRLILNVSGLAFLIFFTANVQSSTQRPTFSPDQQLSFSAEFMASADIDGDGYLDFVSTTATLSDTSREGLYISFGNSSGFGTPVMLAHDIRVAPITLAHIDNDTLLDIITASGFSVGGIFLNNGNRTFARLPFPDTAYISDANVVATGYFNNDAYTDFIMGPWSNPYGGQAKLYLGDGAGGFVQGYTLNHGARAIMVGDFNADGRDDYVCQTKKDTGCIFLATSSGLFTQSAKFFCPGETPGVTLPKGISDFNNDGNADFAFVGFRDPQRSVVTIGFGDGTGHLLSLDTFNVKGYHWMIDAGDLNGDNNIDVFSAGASSVGPGPHIAAFLSDGAGGFDTCTIAHPGQIAAAAMSSGDVDRDGDLDIFVGTEFFGPGPLTILYNDFSNSLSTNKSLSLTGFSGWMGSKSDNKDNSSAVQVEMMDPAGRKFSRTLPGIAGASYWRFDADKNGTIDDKITDNSPLSGDYEFTVRKASPTSSARFSLIVNVPGKPKIVLALNYDGFSGGSPNDSIVFHYAYGGTSSVQPGNGIATGTTAPVFTWPTAIGATAYEFQLDRYHDFRAPIYYDNSLVSASFTLPSGLGTENVYYWHYRSYSGGQWSEYSPTYAAYVSSCCAGWRGNVDGSASDNTTIADITYMVNFLFNGGPAPVCEAEADVNGANGINVMDLVSLVGYLFAGGTSPAACPSF